MLGVVMNDNAGAMVFGRGGDDLHRLICQRIGFRMKFNETQIPIKRKQTGGIICQNRCQGPAGQGKAHDAVGQIDRMAPPASMPHKQLALTDTIGRAAIGWNVWH